MSVQDVDKGNGFVVRKLMSPDRKKIFGYLTLPEGYDGKDISKVRKFASLGEARSSIGIGGAKVTKLTPPKSSYAQNQKGYKADSGSKKTVRRAA